MNKTIIYLFLIVMAICFIFGFAGGWCARKPQTEIQHVYEWDTLVITKIVKDTVLKWYDKILWKDVKPETILKTEYVPMLSQLMSIFAGYYDGQNLKLMAHDSTNTYNFIYTKVNVPFEFHSRQRDIFVKSKKRFPIRPYFSLAGAYIFNDYNLYGSAEIGLKWRIFNIFIASGYYQKIMPMAGLSIRKEW